MGRARLDHEAERRLELAAAVGLDPRKLWPSHSLGSRWSGLELDAYLDGARALAEHGRGSCAEGEEGLEGGQWRAPSAGSGAGTTSGRTGTEQKVDGEHALSALGAAGRFLLSPERAEAERLDSLRETNLLHSGAEEVFDRVVLAARKYFDVGAASLSLIAEDAQYFKSVVGPLLEAPRAVALCTATVERNAMLIINDTATDDRFATNPLVTGEPFIRFYAGYPLHGPRGWNIGTVCVIDQNPRAFSSADQHVLRTLAAIVQREIDART